MPLHRPESPRSSTDGGQLPLIRFDWPSPPYASFPDTLADEAGWHCALEGSTGQAQSCRLEWLDAQGRSVRISLPPHRATIPVRFSMLRSITLRDPLTPRVPAAGEADSQFAEYNQLLNHRPRVQYQLYLRDGTRQTGNTIGYVENSLGLFLFPPVNEDDHVQRVFYPTEAYERVQLGEQLGHVLVEQQAITAAQIESVAQEQEHIRTRKLGDYLVLKEVVSAEQLMQALDQQARMPMVRIGEALTALGLVSEKQLADALEKQRMERNAPLGEMLVQSGMLTRQDLQIALARKMGFPVVDVANFPVDPNAIRKIPYSIASRLRVLPLLFREGALVVAAEDPSRRTTVEELEFAAQVKVVAALASTAQLAQTIPKVYAKLGLDGNGPQDDASLSPEGPQSEPTADLLRESLELQSLERSEENERQIEQSDNSLVRLINTMIIDAHSQGASDIHIETYPSKRKVRIRFRRDGVLALYMELPHTYRSALVARLKIMCDLDISERRKPQDGKIDFARYSSKHPIELRVVTLPTLGGAEDVVMRVLTSAIPVPMDQLGLSTQNYEAITEAINRPYGMVLCVGPTGSGKTTTLHSMLQHLNSPTRKIWTAEDPVEITNPDLRQVQVNAKIDWTFAKALRSFLRADPDVVMVGEIRDKETAQVAIEASLTGHLMLSTLHTNSAPETVIRLLDMGMDPFNFADSLLAILAQRLTRRLCTACKKAEPADAEHTQELLHDYLRAFPPDLRPKPETLLADWTRRYGQDGRLVRYRPVGCSSCAQAGYRGRMGLHELLRVDPQIRHLIQTAARPEEIQQTAMRSGHFRTLRQDGIEKVLQGHTSIDEVRANCN